MAEPDRHRTGDNQVGDRSDDHGSWGPETHRMQAHGRADTTTQSATSAMRPVVRLRMTAPDRANPRPTKFDQGSPSQDGIRCGSPREQARSQPGMYHLRSAEIMTN